MWEDLSSETSARYWERHLWEAIFKQIYRNSFSDSKSFDYRTALPLVFKFIESSDIVSTNERVTNSTIQKFYEETRGSVIQFLKDNNIKCQLAIDSLDVYPIFSPRFSKLFSGFLRCITNMSDSSNNVEVYCCIPEELEPFLFLHTANELRDLSPLTSYSRIHWRPIDLLKIVAERYRLFLKVHHPIQTKSDTKFIQVIADFDFSIRKELMKFYSMIMPKKITNRFGQKENSLAYIVRHTQLLPREFLLLFANAIKISYEDRRSWSFITENSIVASITDLESALSRQILKPYLPMYSDLIENIQEILPELPPICDMSDLDIIGQRFNKDVLKKYANPWKTLFDIGVIGFIKKEDGDKDKEHYEFASFHFNSRSSIVFANHIRYCVHPIFSGAWHLNRTSDMKFVYPNKIDSDFWDAS